MKTPPEFIIRAIFAFLPEGKAIDRGEASRASGHFGRRGQVSCRSPPTSRICSSNFVRHGASARGVFPASLGSGHLGERAARDTARYSRQDGFCTSSWG